LIDIQDFVGNAYYLKLSVYRIFYQYQIKFLKGYRGHVPLLNYIIIGIRERRDYYYKNLSILNISSCGDLSLF
jgi:hypothetical protein